MRPPPVDHQQGRFIKPRHTVTAERMTKVMVDVMETHPRVGKIAKVIQFPASMTTINQPTHHPFLHVFCADAPLTCQHKLQVVPAGPPRMGEAKGHMIDLACVEPRKIESRL